MVGVEPHVLRYWEEELELPIERDAQGKRCYTRKDVERLREIKFWKDKGMQLRAVKEILAQPEISEEFSGSLAEPEEQADQADQPDSTVEYEVIGVEDAADSARRLEQLLDGIITRSLEKNNQKAADAVCDVLIRELEERLDEKLEERARILVEQELMRQMVEQGVRESAAARPESRRERLRSRWKQWLEKKSRRGE